jgi:hypothetical protein
MKNDYVKMLVEESGDLVEKAIKYPDFFSEVLKTLLRHNPNETCSGMSMQRINYSEPFEAIHPFINDYNGIGIEVESFDENGFVISSLSPGNFGYLTIKKL